MKKRRFLKVFTCLVIILSVIALSGCSSSAPGTPSSPGKTQFLNISTSTSGGTFYIVGGKIADMINGHLEGYQATAEVTAGGVENARLLKNGETDLAFFPGDTLYNAVNGLGEFEADGKIAINNLAGLYSSPMQIVVLEKSGIKSIADLKGKKVSIGAPGSSTAVRAEIVLNAHGVTLDDIVMDTTTSSEASTLLNDGMIDCAFFTAGAPSSAIMDVASKNKIAMLPITDEAMKKISAEHPYLYAFNVDADVYPNVPAFTCIASASNLGVSPDMDEQLAYDITKMLFENFDEFAAVHKSIKEEFTLEFATSQGQLAPYHPGAIKYYKEVGAMK